jgi:hypothetical protein
MTESIMSLVVILSLGIFTFGIGRRVLRLVLIVAKNGPMFTERSPTSFPIPKRSWLRSFWLAHGTPWVYWKRSDPLGFAAHLAYHIGLYTAVLAYVVGLVSIWRQTGWGSPWSLLLAVCGWAVDNQPVSAVCRVFQAATVLAVIGLSFPFARRKLGLSSFRPPDDIVAELGFKPTPMPRNGRTGRERKRIGFIVLIADAALAASFFLPEASALLIRKGHATFVVALLAVFPFTFLFHEIWIVVTGTMTVWRYRDGGI